jgi:hypothetical protein
VRSLHRSIDLASSPVPEARFARSSGVDGQEHSGHFLTGPGRFGSIEKISL